MEARATEDVFRVGSETDRVWCACEARRFARSVGFGERAQWELAIVVAELVANAVRYAGSGTLTLRATAPRAGMEIVVRDPGAGRAAAGGTDVPAPPAGARRGLGLGLRTVRCLTDALSFARDPHGGTVVTAARYLTP